MGETAETTDPTDERIALGRWGEDLAAQYLTSRGMRVLERNWRCQHGELDIVAVDRDCLVACEVKTRSGVCYGTPVEAVTWRKHARLRRLVAVWLGEHPNGFAGVRIDVVGVLRPPSGRPVLWHLQGVC
ncbi:MAG: YraN family protein [Nostocoides sp.]